MIEYNWQSERWEEDYTPCNFPMSPKGNLRMFDETFDNWDEFLDFILTERKP